MLTMCDQLYSIPGQVWMWSCCGATSPMEDKKEQSIKLTLQGRHGYEVL